ncbi:MAG: hypothetical protein K8F34_09665 [Candidatus Kuenenia stuttgartiensis]|uniref:Uncharacterized protein n=1 Tax=Kuenenia stuttgartiensis TaxID=174633 RepID=A0A2C9CAL3_KUEST|nr:MULTISPECIES: hypothetical protein [Kuenenia]MBZ0191938.1 hypothetical protein [Candidatus Kuenenia stuttgartiensis]MCL4726233.1 hypothetical protein [Candidatus Kuenenia stuttgartiensis]MCZ7623132.1 hypothetical protein [Candidatus Kuenenia sp.]SOH02638.1 hypothetical protein KSMBR1_0118 [Candidatus Kuenenia stuttgartiensis]GJQ48205.1 MAG: hypothetical protein HKUEN01_05910 [Candidatus Kuenenia stuttgartiensis]
MEQIKNNTIAGFLENIREKKGEFFSAIQDFDGTGDNCFKKCALVYMSVKVFLILLATCSITILFLMPAFQAFVEETSRLKVLLFTSPVILVILFKLYFIGMVLFTYDRSRHVFQLAVKNMSIERTRIILKLRDVAPLGLRHAYCKLIRYR